MLARRRFLQFSGAAVAFLAACPCAGRGPLYLRPAHPLRTPPALPAPPIIATRTAARMRSPCTAATARRRETAERQQFPADADSVAMFRRADMLASTFNTWAMEIDPDQTFVYELTRPDGRRFRVQFDLSQPVDLPPAPWGDEKAPQ